MSARRPLITLITDFGTDDTYVGQMKGVIAGICPEAAVIDLTHAVRPQQVEQGAFLLETAVAAFPPGTIHLAVVDPGVGTERVGLAIRSGGSFFVGPDNGLLSCALTPEARPRVAARVPVPENMQAVILATPQDRLVSPTFHGRDIFAVAATRLATGDVPGDLGSPASEISALPSFIGSPRLPRFIDGRVVHIDRFGNLITTIRARQLNPRPRALILAGTRIEGFVTTYAEGSGLVALAGSSGLVALAGSSGYLEVAEVNGSAAARLGVEIGEPVQVELSSEMRPLCR